MYFAKIILKKLGLLTPLRDWRSAKQVRRWTEHDQKMKLFYSQFLKPGQLCFDIGANQGNRTKIFLALNSKVIAVEPQPKCIDFLNKNFGSNSKFSLEPVGLAESEGEAEMSISEVNTLSSLSEEWIEKQATSGRFKNIGWEGKVKIKLSTFDQLIDKYGVPSFAKIDVEGFELNVLKGLSEKVDFLSFEYAPELQEQIFRCIDLLQSRFSSEFNFSSFETMELDFKEWMDATQLKAFLAEHEEDFTFFGDIYVKNI